LATNALSGLHVLVLEDEFLIAMDVEQICRDHGAEEVLIKRAVEELGDAIWNDDFDVAIIDLMLAGQSTLPFARQLQDRGVPFIFASGYTDSDALRREFPTAPLVGKPYSEAAIIAEIAAAIERSRG